MVITWGKPIPGTTIRTAYLMEDGIEKAFAVVHERDGTVYIADLKVKDPERRKGYGSKLLQAIERKVCDKPRILELLSKPEAVEFWRRQGFYVSHPLCGTNECWKWMAKECRKRHHRKP